MFNFNEQPVGDEAFVGPMRGEQVHPSRVILFCKGSEAGMRVGMDASIPPNRCATFTLKTATGIIAIVHRFLSFSTTTAAYITKACLIRWQKSVSSGKWILLDAIKHNLIFHGVMVMSITPQEVGSYFLTLFGPIAIGIVVAAFTANFALKRFHSEKWWEKKHKAYGDLVDILIEMQAIYIAASNHHERIYRAEQALAEVPDYYFEWGRYRELKNLLRRSYVLAPISLSANTEEHLTRFFKVDAESDEMVWVENYPEQVAYSEMADEVEKLINLIVDNAKYELSFK